MLHWHRENDTSEEPVPVKEQAKFKDRSQVAVNVPWPQQIFKNPGTSVSKMSKE
jgi:hypothetical protein